MAGAGEGKWRMGEESSSGTDKWGGWKRRRIQGSDSTVLLTEDIEVKALKAEYVVQLISRSWTESDRQKWTHKSEDLQTDRETDRYTDTIRERETLMETNR